MAVSNVGGLPVHVVNGVLVPLWIQQELVDKMKTMEHYPGDVWIVSYPKSGTMWTAQIVRLIRNNGVAKATVLSSAVPFPESAFGTSDIPLDELPRPRSMRSHFPYDIFPCGPPHTLPSKFIYLIRNPKDVAVSIFNFAKVQGHVEAPEWDMLLQCLSSGEVPYGDYFNHILSWWAHRDSPNILFLRYEDMKKDLPQAVSTIAAFLHVHLYPSVIQKIADATTFEKMKTDRTANMSWIKMFNDEEGKPSFLRKGEVGDWKNYFSAEQSAEMDRRCEEKLKDTGIEFVYE